MSEQESFDTIKRIATREEVEDLFRKLHGCLPSLPLLPEIPDLKFKYRDLQDTFGKTDIPIVFAISAFLDKIYDGTSPFEDDAT